MKGKEAIKWMALALVAVFLAYLGKINYHQRFPGQFVLIVLGSVAALIFAFSFLSRAKRP